MLDENTALFNITNVWPQRHQKRRKIVTTNHSKHNTDLNTDIIINSNGKRQNFRFTSKCIKSQVLSLIMHVCLPDIMPHC